METRYPKRKSVRLNNYDYSKPGMYYITICVKNKSDSLCVINNDELSFTEQGEILKKVLLNISDEFEAIAIDTFVIIPDHIHLILNLIFSNKIPLTEVVRRIKARSTYLIHKSGHTNFQWQRNYFERIIRDEKELMKFRKYINENIIRYHNIQVNAN